MGDDRWMDETIPSRRVEPVERRVVGSVRGWVVGGMVVVLTLAVCGLWALFLLRGEFAGRGPTPTPIIWTPTSAPTIAWTATPTPTLATPTLPLPTVSPGVAIGRYVRVSGTEGYGLSLRAGPGENYTRMDVAQEGEVFIVVDGPTVSGGSEWWQVQDRENTERTWWAVGNFLEPVEHP